jgi:hypothetical protein
MGAVVYPVVVKRPALARGSASNGRPPEYPRASAPASTPAARRLFTELADLEERFEAGELDEAAYERQRAQLYEKLRSL